MSRALFDDLKARQIAFLEARLVSDVAARQWRERLPAGWDALLATPLGELANAEVLSRAIDALIADERARAALRPLGAAALAALAAAAHHEERRAGEFVPAGARKKIDRLLEQPKLISEELLREVLESDAMAAVMRDVLYEALKEFSDKVNPFFAEWGLPALLKKVAPFGLGGIGKGMSSMKAEFEKRLEPEMRRFLKEFTRTAMRDMRKLIVAKGDSPEFVAMRKHVASWVLDQAIRDLTRQMSEESTTLAQEIGLDVAELALQADWMRERRDKAISAFFTAFAQMPVGEVLRSFGSTPAPDFDALAAVSWPVVRSVCASAPVKAWIAEIVGEFFDGLPDDLG